MSRGLNWLCLNLPMFATAAAVGACSSSANQPPVVTDQQAVTDEDVPVDLQVLDGARDPDGDPLTVTEASAPGHRVEVIDGKGIRLTPKQDFNGSVDVTYGVSDHNHPDVLGHVHVTVRPVNDPPIASGGSRDIHGSDPVTLEGSDVDGDALSFEVVGIPTHGTITGSAPSLQYTPDPGFTGDDAITYRVSDGQLTSTPATLHLHVSPGAPPVASAGAVSGDEDHQLDVVLHASDPDGDAVAFTVVTPPAHGTLGGTAPDLIYTPAPDFNGDDALEFSVSDGFFTSGTASVAIHVAPVNDPPVATPQAVPATEDTSVEIALDGSDVDGDPLTFQITTAPAHGTLTGPTGGKVVYRPALNYNGPDSFTFVASDGKATSTPATVTLQVASVDDPPVAMSFAHTLAEDTPNAVTLVGSDVEGDPLSFAIATPPAHGTLNGTPPNLTYIPAADYNGDDSFTYTVSDGALTSDPGTVTLHVTPVNDAPVAVDSTVTTDEDTAVDFTLQASDVDGQALTYTIVTPPADGTLSGTGASRRYTPAPNANGTRSLTFRVSDGALTATATVIFHITPVNDPPVASDDFAGTDPDTPLAFSVTANDSDVDGDSLALGAVDPPTNGTAEIVDGKLVYTPNAGFTGVDVFGYTVVDGHGGSARGTVHLGVGEFPAGAPTESIAIGAIDFNVIGFEQVPAVSRDGRFIAFTTQLALVSQDTNSVTDVYLYDRSTRAITLVSTDSAGHPGNADSTQPRISADGRYIVFESIATNLIGGDSNGAFDVFRHDRVTGETLRVSVASDGSQGNGNSFGPAISADGNLVAFSSLAFNFTASDANGASDIFVRDVAAGTTERISVGTSGGDADLDSGDPAISADGRFVAFSSDATNLVPGDTNAQTDVFLRDRASGTTTRISVSTNGGEADSASFFPSLSRDGRFVSFQSSATNLVPGTGSQLYVRDLQGQTTTRTPTSMLPLISQLSGDGRFAATSDPGFGVQVTDRFSGTTSPVTARSWSFPAISDNGRYIAALDAGNGGRLVVFANPLSP